MSFRVEQPGSFSLLVDQGRPHHRSLGVPIGGAADRAALAIGNALVGNQPNTVALEITLAGPTLTATADHACVVVGASFTVTVAGHEQPCGTTFVVREGERLEIGTAETGLRGYLCVAGGLESPVRLGSGSAWQPISGGAVLECRPGLLSRRFVHVDLYDDELHTLRLVRGRHVPLLADADLAGREFTVSSESNRMGLRLEGGPLPPPDEEPPSAPVCPGTVQLTNQGQVIVLGVDAQTVGGYPCIAHVISADLDKLAQFCPGDPVQFAWVELDEATRLYRVRQAWLQEWVTRLLATVGQVHQHQRSSDVAS